MQHKYILKNSLTKWIYWKSEEIFSERHFVNSQSTLEIASADLHSLQDFNMCPLDVIGSPLTSTNIIRLKKLFHVECEIVSANWSCLIHLCVQWCPVRSPWFFDILIAQFSAQIPPDGPGQGGSNSWALGDQLLAEFLCFWLLKPFWAHLD